MELLTVFGWLGVQKYFSELSICGNCFFILTLLGVCHETVAVFFPLNCCLSNYVHLNSLVRSNIIMHMLKNPLYL